MNRRKFHLLSASSLLALMAGKARAATSDQIATLQTTLTPTGATRAGNADGSIPTWSGGMSTLPDGVTKGQGLMPDFFANDQKLVSINAANMAQYKDRLSDGIIALMTKYADFRIDVYPTHRTYAAPQWVYDNTAKNAATAKLAPQGGRYGFTDAFGGFPFPIPDSDPNVAGAQIMLNHECQWFGTWMARTLASHVVDNGSLYLASGFTDNYLNCYYQQDKTFATWNGFIFYDRVNFVAPAVNLSEQIVDYTSMNPLTQPTEAWIYLAGQGRVRKAPELEYDNPEASTNGIMLIDENGVFDGALNKYDWKLVGKKEMYIPYNSNKVFLSTPEAAHLPNFINPDLVRWELHRVWVVEATLAPGERHVVPHKRFYVDEDSWLAVLSDGYDANGNFWRLGMGFPETRPDIPTTGYIGNISAVYDLQANKYVTNAFPWNVAPYNKRINMEPQSMGIFNPQDLAAQDQY
jgi:hypothetical protein